MTAPTVVRFLPRRWRKAACSVCWSLVARPDIEAHARRHVLDGAGVTQCELGFFGHNDVRVFDDMHGAVHVTQTGWVTEDRGAR